MDGLSVAIAIGGIVLSVATFYIGRIKASKDDGQSNGVFIGEVKTELKYIREAVAQLSNEFARDREERAKMRAELHEEFSKMVDNAIKTHEKRYHNED